MAGQLGADVMGMPLAGFWEQGKETKGPRALPPPGTMKASGGTAAPRYLEMLPMESMKP